MGYAQGTSQRIGFNFSVLARRGKRKEKMIDLAFKNMWMRKIRSILTILGVAVAVMLFVMMTVTLDFVTEDLEQQMGQFAGKMFVQAPSTEGISGAELVPKNSSIPNEDAKRIMECALKIS